MVKSKTNQPQIKNTPPKGVSGKSHFGTDNSIALQNVMLYNDPENKTIPPMKKLPAHLIFRSEFFCESIAITISASA